LAIDRYIFRGLGPDYRGSCLTRRSLTLTLTKITLLSSIWLDFRLLVKLIS